MTTYTAVFEHDATGWWYVSVPELAGCHTQGRTLDHARTGSAKPSPCGSTRPKTR